MIRGSDALTRKTFSRWLNGQAWIGVFECADLSSEQVGRRVAFHYDISEWDRAEVGKTTAPDHPAYGLGWRFLLKAKCRTVEEAVAALEG
jgi:hypothetical protein